MIRSFSANTEISYELYAEECTKPNDSGWIRTMPCMYSGFRLILGKSEHTTSKKTARKEPGTAFFARDSILPHFIGLDVTFLPQALSTFAQIRKSKQ